MHHHLKKYLTNAFAKPRVPVGIFVVGLLLMAVLSGSAVYYGRLNGRANLGKHFALGQLAEVNGIAVGAAGVRTFEQATPGFPLQDGKKFVIVTVALENRTDKNFELLPLLYFYLKDSQGNVYSVTSAPVQGSQLSGPLPPGDKVREEIGFEVPKAENNFTLYFERGTPDHPVVAIDLFEGK